MAEKSGFVRSLGFAFTLRRSLEPRLDRAVELDRQRITLAVGLLAELDADPAFGDAVFLDVTALVALEADADATLEQLGVEMRALRVDREPVGRGIAHGKRL